MLIHTLKLLFILTVGFLLLAKASGQDLAFQYYGEERVNNFGQELIIQDSVLYLLGKNPILTKVRLDGSLVWARDVQASVNVFPEAFVLSEAAIFITGLNNANGTAFLMKTDTSGRELWFKSFGAGIGREVEWVDDALYLGITRFGYSNQDTSLYKLDLDGEIQWARPSGDVISIASHTDGSLRVLLNDRSLEGNEVWVQHYSSEGQVRGAQSYALPGGEDLASHIEPTDDGNFIVNGRTRVNDETFDPFLMKLDEKGRELWTRTYPTGFIGFSPDDHVALEVCQDGGFAMLGASLLPFGWHGIRTNALGDTVFTFFSDKGYIEGGYGVREGPNQNLYFFGSGFRKDVDQLLMRYESGLLTHERTRLTKGLVYPNPVRGRLTLPTEVIGVQLFDRRGRWVELQDRQVGPQVSLEHLPRGIYSLVLHLRNGLVHIQSIQVDW